MTRLNSSDLLVCRLSIKDADSFSLVPIQENFPRLIAPMLKDLSGLGGQDRVTNNLQSY
jgi:hypothetical protein